MTPLCKMSLLLEILRIFLNFSLMDDCQNDTIGFEIKKFTIYLWR